MQEAMIIGQFSQESPLTWVRIRSEEELFKTDFTNIKMLVVAGSFDSDLDPQQYISKSIKSIYDNYPQMTFFGFGAGTTLLAPLTGLGVEYSETKEISFLGRRQLNLPTVGPTVLQYVKGSWKLTKG